MARGPRDSEWLVLRRCLAIVRRLVRGPARPEKLATSQLAETCLLQVNKERQSR